jgi:hypothetical protein
MTCDAESIGKMCEEMATHICESLGYDVRPAPSRTSAFDLVVNGVRLQVKKRTTRSSRPNRIEMKTSRRGGVYAYTTSEVDAFAVLCDGQWFVFPSQCVADELGRVPNDIDVRRVSKFENAWHVLCGGSIEVDRQLGFDF